VRCVALAPDERRILASGKGWRLWDVSGAGRLEELQRELPDAWRRQGEGKATASDLERIGRWYELHGYPDWASMFLERANQLNPDHTAVLPLARCYWTLGQQERARQAFAKAVERKEAPAEYLRLCLGALERKTATDEEQ